MAETKEPMNINEERDLLRKQVQLLARRVKFALSHLDCKGDGILYELGTGTSKGHWTRVFAADLRECGFDCDDDSVDYAKTPASKRKGPEWKALVAKLKAKGYNV